MNDKQIECFMTVADCLNFTLAAERMFVSQPTISRLIHSLEEELGFSLFYRSNKEVRLTPSGLIMHEMMCRVKKEYEIAKERAENLNVGITGRIQIGFSSNLELEELWEHMIPEFQKTYQNIQLVYICVPQEQLLEQLLDGTVDLAFLHGGGTIDSKRFVFDSVFETNMKLVCGMHHPIAQKGGFQAEDLSRETVWTVFQKEVQQELLAPLYNYFGVDQIHIQSAQDFNTVLINVRMGNGILFIDPVTKSLNPKHYMQFSLPDPFGKVTIGAMWAKQNHNPALPLLLQFMQD